MIFLEQRLKDPIIIIYSFKTEKDEDKNIYNDMIKYIEILNSGTMDKDYTLINISLDSYEVGNDNIREIMKEINEKSEKRLYKKSIVAHVIYVYSIEDLIDLYEILSYKPVAIIENYRHEEGKRLKIEFKKYMEDTSKRKEHFAFDLSDTSSLLYDVSDNKIFHFQIFQIIENIVENAMMFIICRMKGE